MKLRLQANSLRLRLKRGEVEQLIAEGAVEESVAFGKDQVLRFRLQTVRVVSVPHAVFAAGEVDVAVPLETAVKWAAGNEVGIEAIQSARDNSSLHILIEKDFACLNGLDEQNIDTFPNPLAGTSC